MGQKRQIYDASTKPLIDILMVMGIKQSQVWWTSDMYHRTDTTLEQSGDNLVRTELVSFRRGDFQGGTLRLLLLYMLILMHSSSLRNMSG